MDDLTRADLCGRTERWFVQRGLPHFIDQYRATTDVWTRAAPFLTSSSWPSSPSAWTRTGKLSEMRESLATRAVYEALVGAHRTEQVAD